MKLDIFIKHRDTTYTAFAQKIGDSPQNVSRYALGKRMPKKDKMQRIAHASGYLVTANDFYDINIPHGQTDFSGVKIPPASEVHA